MSKSTGDGSAVLGDVYLMPHERGESDEPLDGINDLEGLLGLEDPEEQDNPQDEPVEEDDGLDSLEEEVREDDLDEELEDEEGLDEEEEEPGEEGPEDEDLYEVVVDGETHRVTLEELRSGYSRTQDYTRKQQQRAEKEREAEAARVEAQQAREQYLMQLGALSKALDEFQGGEEPDWDALREEDPARYAAAWADWQKGREKRQLVQAEQQRVIQEYQQEQRSLLDSTLQKERQRLREAIPEWKDPEKAEQEKGALAQYAQETYGFTEQDLGQVVDHRVMLVLRKAMRYDELQQKRGEVEGKTRAGKVLKPGSAPQGGLNRKRTKKLRRAGERLARTGRVEDAAALIENTLGDDEPELR